MTYERVNQPKVEPYKLLANETCHWFWILLPSKVSPSGRPAGGNNKKENLPALRATSFTKGGFYKPLSRHFVSPSSLGEGINNIYYV